MLVGEVVGEELVLLVGVKGLEADDAGVDEEGVDVLTLCSLWASKMLKLATLA